MCFLTLASQLFAWGGSGHKIINMGAIHFLPEPLKRYYRLNEATVVGESITPDLWKGDDREEGPRHYIDIDRYEAYPFPSFPASFDDFVSRFGKAKVEKNGTVTWRIEEMFKLLKDSFAQGDWKSALDQSGWLGHYVADMYEPFHTTDYHDGKTTSQKGIHLRFEDKMLRRLMSNFRVTGSSQVYVVSDVPVFVMDVIREGYPHIDELCLADDAAQKKGPAESTAYYAELYRLTGRFAKVRMTSASHGLASLWYTAWVQAGKPAPPRR